MDWLLEPNNANVRAVHKVVIPLPESGTTAEVEIPRYSKILFSARQHGAWSVWYETDMNWLNSHPDDKLMIHFEWFGTGYEIKNRQAEWITTDILYGGALVVHLYWWVA